MNKNQRMKNRRTAYELARDQKIARKNLHVCENCGERGGHWVSTRGTSLAALITGQDDQAGFWTCPKYYGPDGRRINPEPMAFGHELSGMLVAVLTGNGTKELS